MTIQRIVEDFEKGLWDGQNPDILEYVQQSPKNKQQALYLLLREATEFYESAMKVEIPESVLKKISDNFEKQIRSEKYLLKAIESLRDFFELAQSLGKQWQELEQIFKIPIPKLQQLSVDSTPLSKPSDFGREQRLLISEKYSIDFSLVNYLVNRAFTAIRILEDKPSFAFTRSKEGDIEHFEENKEKLINAIFQEETKL